MARLVALFCAVLVGLVALVAAKQTTVHIIAHTHDDVGWLKTVDQYYYGANNSIQDARVQYILDTVMANLLMDPNKKFIYVEIAYFMRWWREQTEQKKQTFRGLVSSGQFEFINGGWCMNDEASIHYEATIDQMTEGHTFLLQEFGVTPRIGWQIDPFGHASGYANLLALMGYDALFFARIDYQDYAVRTASKSMEYIWRPTQSFGAQTQIFTHAMFDGTYCYGPNTAYEWDDQPVMDDPNLEDYNVELLANEFANDIATRTKIYATDQILYTFGCDFGFSDAFINFKNMDKLMKFINNNTQYDMTVMYSTPSIYLEAVAAKNTTWPLKTDDHFPYADMPHAYWSGYFTSRQALKGYERLTSAELHAAEKIFATVAGQLEANAVNTTAAVEAIDEFAQSHGIAQHHDGVSGTSKQHVADDYALRLYLGELGARQVISDVIGSLIAPSGQTAPDLSFCPLLNISQCPSSQSLVANQFLPIIVYNSLSFTRTEAVRVVVSNELSVTVFDSNGNVVPSQTDSNFDDTTLNTVTFFATVSAMGFETYVLGTGSGASTTVTKEFTVQLGGSDVTLQGAFVSATVSGATGRLSSISNLRTGQTLAVDQVFMWYNSSNHGDASSGQAGGAYIFRPNSSTPLQVTGNNSPMSVSVVSGDLVQEVRQIWTTWLTQIIRVYNNSVAVEQEITVDPMPIDDGLGKELFSRVTTQQATNGTWWTDSIAQEMQQRWRNYRPTWNYQVNEPVAGNYFPMNTAAYQQDATTRLTVLTDRSRGMGSIADGQMETTMQRRLLADDSRGVGEPLNETVPVRAHLHLLVGPTGVSADQRIGALRLNNPFQLFFGTISPDNSWVKAYRTSFAPLVNDLPPNVQLITLRTLEDGQVLLRLSHIFASNEDSTWSQAVSLNLGDLFADYTITAIVETQLTANQPLSQINRMQWNTVNPGTAPSVAFDPHPINSIADGLQITMHPLQIRSFVVTLTAK